MCIPNKTIQAVRVKFVGGNMKRIFFRYTCAFIFVCICTPCYSISGAGYLAATETEKSYWLVGAIDMYDLMSPANSSDCALRWYKEGRYTEFEAILIANKKIQEHRAALSLIKYLKTFCN